MEFSAIEKKYYSIELKVHGLIEDTFSKKILFFLKVSDGMSENIKYRNNLEFNHLRSRLVKKWVSVAIPSFSKLSLSVMKNVTDDYLERKRASLENFLKECVNISEIVNSFEFQLFIKSGDNFIENSRVIDTDYRQIYTRFALIYKITGEKINENKEEISKIVENFKNADSELKVLKKTVKQLYEKYENLRANHKSCFKKFHHLKSTYLNDLNTEKNELTDYNTEINPFKGLLYWVTHQCLTIKSIIESTDKFFEMFKVSIDLNNKLEKKKQKLTDLENGKQDFASIFEGKSQEEIKIKENFSVNEMENLTECVNLIKNIVSSVIINKIIPEYNANKRIGYYHGIEGFCSQVVTCFNNTV